MPDNCKSCDFYLAQPGLQSPALVAANEQQPVAGGFGYCRLRPPATRLLMQPSPLDPRRAQSVQLPTYPIVPEDGLCERHPARLETTWKGAIRYAIKEYRLFLDYKPGEHPDEFAAGFSRVPTLEEVFRLFEQGKIDAGPRAQPGAPLPADTFAPSMPEGFKPSGKDTKPLINVAQIRRKNDTWLGRLAKRVLLWTRGL